MHIVDRRRELGLSQQKVAEACGTIQQTIAKIERGERKLTLDWAQKLAIPLEWTPTQIMFGDKNILSARIVGDLLSSEAVAITGDPEVVSIDTPPIGRAEEEFQAVRVATDALEPRLFHGDTLIFASNPTDPSEANFRECLISIGDEMFVRRVELVDNGQMMLRGYKSSTPTLTVSQSRAVLFRLLSINPPA